MKDKELYLRWLSILCAGLTIFCVAIFATGYKDMSFGRVTTVVVLVALSILFFWMSQSARKRSGKSAADNQPADRTDAGDPDAEPAGYEPEGEGVGSNLMEDAAVDPVDSIDAVDAADEGEGGSSSGDFGSNLRA